MSKTLIKETLALLEAIEWSAWLNTGGPRCPSCGGMSPESTEESSDQWGHMPLCDLYLLRQRLRDEEQRP